MNTPRLFDLNIEKILEAWDDAHAVRELIANALDEQVLTGTSNIEITKRPDGTWLIRDYGRGLRYEHFTQNESVEKLANAGRVIGKFGVGLKDALATLHRNGVEVKIHSAHGTIALEQTAKHGFDDVVTLHASVLAAGDPAFEGTAIALRGLADDQMDVAKSFFLKFSNETVLEETRYGQILVRQGERGRVYMAGLLIAEEDNFAFSYNITSMTEAMKKALNRERTNVGRTAYTERVKQMLLQTGSQEVAAVLADQLVALQSGAGADEVRWKDVAVHACRIRSASGRYLFVTASQLLSNASSVGHARDDGLQIVVVPDSIHAEIVGIADLSGAPIRDIGTYQSEWNSSFQFDFVDPSQLTGRERAVYERAPEIIALGGGLPPDVEGIRISQTMRLDPLSGSDALGLWDAATRSIVIRRDQLQSLDCFAGTLLHEMVHARTGFDDVTQEFECGLTDALGEVAANALASEQGAGRSKQTLWSKFGFS